MDINLLREVTTVVSFITFIGIVRYALNPRHKQRFEAAATSVLNDDDQGGQR